LDWYLEQVAGDIGDSSEETEAAKKKINLIIRRLINVDRILVTVGEAPKSKRGRERPCWQFILNMQLCSQLGRGI
jgi:hypothetical protein